MIQKSFGTTVIFEYQLQSLHLPLQFFQLEHNINILCSKVFATHICMYPV